MGSLQAHEQRLHRSAGSSIEKVLKTKQDLQKGSSEGSESHSSEKWQDGRGRGRGHGLVLVEEEGVALIKAKGTPLQVIKIPIGLCCKGFCHIQRDCWSKRRDYAN